jgi:hypothetical protein
MGMASIRSRLLKLEDEQRFLDWFVMERFYATLTLEELSTFARCGELPNPLQSRPSTFPGALDRKSLIKLWQEHERILGGRSGEELEYYVKTGAWPEQKGGLHYSTRDGELTIEWRIERREENTPVTS